MLEVEKLNSELLEYENDLEVAKKNFKKWDKEYKSVINKKNMIDATTAKYTNEIEQAVRIQFKLKYYILQHFILNCVNSLLYLEILLYR